jgi:methionyl-tRNA formyltransferase
MRSKKHKEKIIIATVKSWNISNAHKFKDLFKKKYDIFVITNKEELNYESVRDIIPKYIFFPHWSWIIPKDIYDKFNCVVFHMTDLPYGRGGSPLQNLIQKKVYDTKISAIKVEAGIDTGDIYLKEPLHIGIGNAEEMFQKASDIIFFKMIPFILKHNPEPYAQEDNVVTFKRRSPEESNLLKADLTNLNDFYDYIRMLDGEGYPKAFVKIGKFRVYFNEVHKKSDKLVGRFEIMEDNEK